jgi:hypothetical protein
LVAGVWVHERQHTGQTMSHVMAAFRGRFNMAPPRRATLLDWEKRTFVGRCTVTSRPPCTVTLGKKIIENLFCLSSSVNGWFIWHQFASRKNPGFFIFFVFVHYSFNRLENMFFLFAHLQLSSHKNLFVGRKILLEELIPIYIQQDETLHGLFYLETALHVSGGTSIAAGSSNGVTNTRCCRYGCLRSWWWVVVPLETCRAVPR